MTNKIHDNIDDEVDEDELYNLDKMILMRNNDVSVRLKSNSNIYIILKDRIVWLVYMKTKLIKYLNAIYYMIY